MFFCARMMAEWRAERPEAMIDSVPSPPMVQRQLERMLASGIFTGAFGAASLLDLTVTSTLNGTLPTDYEIGLKLFDQPADWTPDGTRSVVRVARTRLRRRLNDYYQQEGADDLVIIELAGREFVSKYNYDSPFMPSPPSALSLDFVARVESYFTDPFAGGLRCVVTGSTADWHHLDGDPYNNAIGNLIPLCELLRSHIDGLRQGKTTTNLPELEPRYLAEDLARRHIADWQMAKAYGCAHLAFHMGEPPFANESDDVRIMRLSDAISHVRHRFNESIVAYLIRHSLLPLVCRIDSIDPRAMWNLALQLSGLSDESGYFDTATGALALAESLVGSFDNLIYHPGSLNRFSLLQRQAQLLMERKPADEAFVDLTKRAEEQIYNTANLPLTLQVLTTARSFRQGTIRASRQTYEALLPITARFTDAMFNGRRFARPGRVDSSNLVQLFIFSGLAACRVRPQGWEDYAKEMITKGKRLCQESGFRFPPEFWKIVSEETFEANPKAQRVSQLPGRYVMPKLRESARTDIETVIRRLQKMLVVEKPEPSLNWNSPWSASPSRQP
jgi:hypothetical protein